MKARDLIEGASFQAEQLALIGEAFDAAWDDLGQSVGTDPDAVEQARLRLAGMILELAPTFWDDPATLTKLAVRDFQAPCGDKQKGAADETAP